MEFSRRRQVETPTGARLDLNGSSRSGRAAQPLQRDARKRRHAGLFEAVHRLDGRLDAAAREALAKWIRDEYEREFGDIPLGFVALCHLGPPFVDHRLDLLASIVEHYSPADVMPEPYAQARMLARGGAYEYVEVWASGKFVPVLSDGTPVS